MLPTSQSTTATQRSRCGDDQTIITDRMRQCFVSVLKEVLHVFSMRYQSSDNLTEFVLTQLGLINSLKYVVV